MKRRIICALLTALILLSVVSVGAAEVSAVSDFTSSDKIIELLKELEGFRARPYPDNGHYSIGYGTQCKATDFPNGINEAQGELLLRYSLTKMEESVNKFADRYNLKLTQNQFDALMMFTYNCGSGWTNSDSDFRQSVINRDTGNDFIYYMTRWCTDGTKVLPGLVKRRLAEADMYLHGYYSKEAPSNYSYVLFDANEGICDVRIQGYDASEPVAVKPEPVYTGYRFLGWYTAKEGGKWITNLDKSTKGITLYAHWQKDEGNVDEDGNVLGMAAEYQRFVSGNGTAVRKAPKADAEVIKTLPKNTEVTILSDYVDAGGSKWGILKEGGWIKLSDTTVDTVADAKPDRPVIVPEEEKAIEVTVTHNGVNLRKAAGTDKEVLGTAHKGDKLTITKTMAANGLNWGKSAKGWIALMYTTYDKILMEQEKEDTAGSMSGTVANCGTLRIRYSPSTNAAILGSLSEGTRVTLLERKTVSGIEWGKISSGWICLTYVKLDKVNQENPGATTPPATEPAAPETEPTVPATEPTVPETEPTVPEQGTGSGDQSSETKKVIGTVISTADLNIRTAPGTHNARVGGYPTGTKIEILEQKYVGTVAWGRTDKGWVCMEYVDLRSTEMDGSVPGLVVCNAYLNVRSGPGVSNRLVTRIATQTRVTVHEQRRVGGVAWGRIDQGWVCMEYIRLDTDPQPPVPSTPPTPTTPPASGTTPDTDTSKPDTDTTPDTGSATGVTGKVVRTNALCLRSGAGTNNKVLETLKMGTKVTIYQQTVVNGMVWGRTDKGWVSMNYIELDASKNDKPLMTGTVTASALWIRSAAGTGNATRGTYAQGTRVEILETKTVGGTPWGRTDKGWICLSYVA